MFKNLFKLNALVALFIIGLFSSCSEEASPVDVDNYVTEATYEIQKAHRIGKPGCFEVVFPLTIELPDGTTAEADSYANIKEVIRAWKEANPDVDGRPTLVYPIEVMTEDGELISLNDKAELIELLKECRASFIDGPRDHHNHGKFRACFDVEFPVTLTFPDGTTAEAASGKEVKMLLRNWRKENPDSAERPTLNFPIAIVYEDGTSETINSKEELIEAKKACRD
jgi:hypothetical protein